jgi:hypothetical protein
MALFFVARFSHQGSQFELPNAGSESMTICLPHQGGAGAAPEKFAKRFDLDFKPFAHGRERPYDQLMRRKKVET